MGWSLKKLHRYIVTSATYRQASVATPEKRTKDPENRLLAHGPRVRLDAELVRDTVLTDSGLLSPKIGGPSVFPPQQPGITTEGAYGQLKLRCHNARMHLMSPSAPALSTSWAWA